MNKIKNFLWYLLPFILRSSIPLLTLPLFTVYLQPSDYGFLALATVYGTFIVGLANMGLLYSFEKNYFKYETYHQRNEFLWTLVISVLSMLSVLLGVSLFFESQIENTIFKTKLPEKILLYSIIYIGLKSVLQYFYTNYRNAEIAKRFSILNLLETIFCNLLSLLFVFFLEEGISGYVKGQAIGVSFLVLLFFINGLWNKRIFFNYSILVESLKFGFPLTPRVFIGVLNNQFDRYMLSLLDTISATGIYDLGQKISNLSFTFITTLHQVYIPTVYKTYYDDRTNFSYKIAVFLRPFLYLSFLVSFVIALFAEELLVLLTPSTFHNAIPVVMILTMLYGTYFFAKQPQLLLANKTGLISFFSLFSLLINIALNIPLINLYGIYGAAWGTFCSGLLVQMTAFYYGQKYLPIYYTKEALIIFVCFLSGILFFISLWFLQIDYWFRFPIKIIALFFFLFIGHYFKYFTKEKFHELIRKLSKK